MEEYITVWNVVGLLVLAFVVYSILHIVWIVYQNRKMREMSQGGTILEVTIEKDTELEPFAVEQMWSTFHYYKPWHKRLKSAQPYLSFEIKSENSLNKGKKKREISFNFWVPDVYKNLVKDRLQATYPKAQIKELSMDQDYIPDMETSDLLIETAELGLREDSAFSIKTFKDLKVDPLASIMSSLSTLEEGEVSVVQVMARPTSHKWNRASARILAKYEKTKKKPSRLPEWTNYGSKIVLTIFKVFDHFISGLFHSETPDIKEERPQGSSLDTANQKEMLEKVQRPGYEIQVRILVGTPYGNEYAKDRLFRIQSGFQELNSSHNGFKKIKYVGRNTLYDRMKNRQFNVIKNRDVLTTVELAGFAHLPNKEISTAGLKKIQSKRNEVPNDISNEDPFAFAVDTQGLMSQVGLDLNARMRHVYVSGMTGVGKSTLLENMIVTDIENNKGVCVIDPHGELVDVILEKISTKRSDIYVLDPSDIGHPFGMNLLEITSKDPVRKEMEKVLVIDAYITSMKRVFGDGAIGPNTDDIFRMSCSAILDHPDGGSLLEMLLMLVSDQYRRNVVNFIKDPIVKNYWDEVFPALNTNKQFATQNLNAPLNKIRRFIANGVVSNIICQKKSTINVAEVINAGGVILARFSRGDMGFENSALLGTMLISKIQIAAMQRVAIPMELRVATFLYVDEFQNFVGDAGGAKSFAEILSEARKYRLGLVIAHQFIDQLRQSGGDFLMSAIFNNCGTIITFRVGSTDSQFFEKIYWDPVTEKGYRANEIANLDKFEVIVRVMTKTGIQSAPFTAKTMPPVPDSPLANAELLKERSRQRITVPRETVRKSLEQRMKWDTISDNDL